MGALTLWTAGVPALLSTPPAAGTPSEPAPEAGPIRRIEARSADLWAVATVRGDRMTIHLSRIVDNAPVRDALVAVAYRGTTHPTIAETDGGYSLQSPDLRLPGAAAMQFQVTRGAAREDLDATLPAADRPEHPDENGSSRQLGWWLLNFAVCIGFLMLWSRRKKAEPKEPV